MQHAAAAVVQSRLRPSRHALSGTEHFLCFTQRDLVAAPNEYGNVCGRREKALWQLGQHQIHKRCVTQALGLNSLGASELQGVAQCCE